MKMDDFLNVFIIKLIREKNIILLDIDRRRFLKIIFISSFSLFVQLDIDEILSESFVILS